MHSTAVLAAMDGKSHNTPLAFRLHYTSSWPLAVPCRTLQGAVLLGAHVTGTKDDGGGRLVLKLQVRLLQQQGSGGAAGVQQLQQQLLQQSVADVAAG